jgi:superfamily II DNA or RNA helicase
MRAVLRDNRQIHFENITQVEEDLVAAHFSLKIENHNKFIDPTQRGPWDGVYRRYNAKAQTLARPYLGDLAQMCNAQGLALDIVDTRPPWKYQPDDPEAITPDYLAGITLCDYQIRAIKAALRAEVGIIKSPTGSGKTEIIAALCKAIRCPTIIFADQLIIIDQIKERLELRDVLDEGGAGLFYAGKTPAGQLVVIGSIASLQTPTKIPAEPIRQEFALESDYLKAKKKHEASLKGYRSRMKRSRQFQDLAKLAEMIIVDECDLAASNQYRQLFRYYCNARRRYGLSGTPFDDAKPLNNLYVREHLGSVIVEIERAEVQAAGRIIPITYYMLAFGLSTERTDASMFDLAYMEYVAENPEFHKLVKMICDTYPNDGVFILVDRDVLGKALEEYIPGSKFIHGKTSPKKRTEVLEAFERRELKILIGGKILERGLDLDGGCETMIITTGGKIAGKLNQKIGRAVRRNKLGRGRVYDFYFMKNKHLYKHSQGRLKIVVNQLGYQTWVIFQDGQVLDGAKFIKSRFHLPKPKL